MIQYLSHDYSAIKEKWIEQNDKKDASDNEKCMHCEVKTVKILSENDVQLAHAIFSLKKDPYESTYDDFMELWLQYGHVFLFGTVYPLAAFLALANNLIGKLNNVIYKSFDFRQIVSLKL